MPGMTIMSDSSSYWLVNYYANAQTTLTLTVTEQRPRRKM